MLLTAAAGSPVADPLEPARRGMVQCEEPVSSPEGETCEAIATYRFLAGGEIRSEARMRFPLENEPDLIIEDRVTVVDGSICSRLEPGVIRGARFEKAGVTVNTPELSAFKEMLIEAMAPLMGKEGCERHVGEVGLFASEVWIEGKEVEAFRGKASWVAPERARLRTISAE